MLQEKRRALVWFQQELRPYRRQLAVLVPVTALEGILADGLLPYCIAWFLEEYGQDTRNPSAFLGVICIPVLVVLVVPLHIKLRIKFVSAVQSKLAQRSVATTINGHGKFASSRGERIGQSRTFFTSWQQVAYAILNQAVLLFIGVISLIVLMSMRAPTMIGIVAVTTGVVAVTVQKFGKPLSASWKRVTQAEHEELAAFDAVSATSNMHWLAESLSSILVAKATAEREQAWKRHTVIACKWQLAINLVIGLLLIGAVAFCMTSALSTATAFLVVWYSIFLGRRLYTLFYISEVLGTALTDANDWVETLEARNHTKPLLRPQAWGTITFEDVVICHRDKENKVEVAVRVPDMCLVPGLTVLKARSGRGKTTLLDALQGNHGLYEGSIKIGPHEVADFDVRPCFGYAPQKPEELDVPVWSLFGKDAEDLDKEAVREILDHAAYPEASLERSLATQSGGEQRRIFVAAAMYWSLQNQAILLLDEPTNDLDQESIRTMADGILKFAADNPEMIIVVVTHESQLLEAARRVIEM